MDPDLVERFEQERPRLRSIAQRMLGAGGDVDDVVQETWLRLDRTDADAIESLPAWLTTVSSRLCLDRLRGTRTGSELTDHVDPAPGPERLAAEGDAVEQALQVVLATLSPAERLAFVLHDLFTMPFEEVAAVMGRSPAAVRQLASRGRRRVQGEPVEAREEERRSQRQVITAFFAASRDGDLRGLVKLLDPQAVVRADAASVSLGVQPVVVGADAVAGMFSGWAQGARNADVDGYAGALWSVRGEVKAVIAFTLTDALITEIELIADDDVLPVVDLVPLKARDGR